MSEAVIKVSDVGIRFRINSNAILSLKEFVTTAARGKLNYKMFAALSHISFSVGKGETIGLVGNNGAGKSTSLKVIAGIMEPSEGSVVCKGNIVPMLEFSAGFDADLTGRESIF